MSFQVKKKISIPSEQHLQNEKVKKRRSKMFIQSHNTTDSSVSLDTSDEVNPNCACIIRQDLFSEYNSQLSYCGTNDITSVSIFDSNGANTDTTENMLNQLLNDLDKNEDEMKCKAQPVNPFVTLRSKVKRVDFFQRFGDGGNKIDGFQYKRKMTAY